MNLRIRTLTLALLLTAVLLTALTGCAYPAAPEGGEETSTSIWPVIIFTVVLFGMFYFLAIRPQRKRQKQQQNMMQELVKGDKVITAGGIHGVIERLDEDTAVLKVEDGGTIRIARSSIAGKISEPVAKISQ